MVELSKPCALCGSTKGLLVSHILPAFVFRWLRESGGTPHIRNSKKPNVRVQDGLKFPLLCGECEAQFSGYETPFATNIFYPLVENDHRSVRYGEWMIRFCVSVSWRLLRYAVEEQKFDNLDNFQKQFVQRALSTWAGFLGGRVHNPGIHEQHILLASPIESHTLPDLPSNMNRYLLRAVHADIPYSRKSVFTYAKLGPFLLFGYVQPPPKKWKGTKVHVHSGKIMPGQYELPSSVFSYLVDQAREISGAMESVSKNQIQKIDQSVLANIDRFASSKHFEAMLYDARLFGEEAIIRKERPPNDQKK